MSVGSTWGSRPLSRVSEDTCGGVHLPVFLAPSSAPTALALMLLLLLLLLLPLMLLLLLLPLPPLLSAAVQTVCCKATLPPPLPCVAAAAHCRPERCLFLSP
jgi:hypothetical protein